MKKVLVILITMLLSADLWAQTDPEHAYRNFPLVITLQFHCLSLPFRDLKTNFSNVGVGIGTELSLNGKDNWAQQFNAVWYHNKAVGNGLFFYTQSAWRPSLSSGAYSELKAGAGYLFAFRPVDGYRKVKGEWVPAGRKGKGMLALPVGASVGYGRYSVDTYVSPFVTYQFLLLKGYSQSIPLVPETLIQTGVRIHPK